MSEPECTVNALATGHGASIGETDVQANRTCRICLHGSGEEALCSPCPCRGSMRFVHQSCLRKEFLAKRQWTCLTCSICANEYTGEVALELAHLAVEWAEADWGLSNAGTFVAVDHLGRLLMSTTGDLQSAEQHLRRAVSGLERILGSDHPETLIAISNLGILLNCSGQHAEAEPLVRRAWDGSRVRHGEEHSETLVFGMNLATVLRELERCEEAEPLLRTALKGLGKQRGEQHPDTLAAASHLGRLLLHLRKDLGEAEPLARRAWEGSLRHFGLDHPRTLEATANLGSLLLERGRPGEGEPLLRDALRGFQSRLGAEHSKVLAVAADLGAALFAAGRKLEAETPLRSAWEGRCRALGEEHLRTAASAHNLGVLLADLRRPHEAVALLQSAWNIRKDKLGLGHPRTLASAAKLGPLLQSADDPGAAALLRALWEGYTIRHGGTHPKTVGVARSLAATLLRWDLEEEAEAVLLRAFEAATSAPPDEEGADQVAMLREALLDRSYDPAGWRQLLDSTARRPPAVELLECDLLALQARMCRVQEQVDDSERVTNAPASLKGANDCVSDLPNFHEAPSKAVVDEAQSETKKRRLSAD